MMFALRQTLTLRRIKLGLSQREVAQRAGLDQSTVSLLETGAVRSPGIMTIAKWARSLDCEIDLNITARGADVDNPRD
jgi:transcriptional regulator with XRE-family HTH domain